MAQACPNCRWYSPDEARVCSHCGEPMPDSEELPLEEQSTPAREIWNWIQFLLGIGVLGLFCFVAYNRYGDQIGGGREAIRAAFQNLTTYVLGAGGEYADFIRILLLLTAAFWFVLWLFNRLNR